MMDKIIGLTDAPSNYSRPVFRLVETQEVAATSSIVDTAEEQFLLESLLDEVKPQYRENTEQLHYLISSPFRYPPLKYGSRFGSVTTPSFYYASETVEIALAESAYYRFVFLYDMNVPYESSIKSEHCSFSVLTKTNSSCDLTCIADKDIAKSLVSPLSYALTQDLGDKVRDNGLDLIRFYSARKKGGINVAISEPNVIVSTTPQNMANWLCTTKQNSVSFSSLRSKPITFSLGDFLVDGMLPNSA